VFVRALILIVFALVYAASVAGDANAISCETLVPRIIEASKNLQTGVSKAEAVAALGVKDCANLQGVLVNPIQFSEFRATSDKYEVMVLKQKGLVKPGSAGMKALVFKNGTFVGHKYGFVTSKPELKPYPSLKPRDSELAP